MGVGQGGGRRLDSDSRRLHYRVRTLRGSWGSGQLFFAERAYPSPRASTDSDIHYARSTTFSSHGARYSSDSTLSSHDFNCDELSADSTTAGDSPYSGTDATCPDTDSHPPGTSASAPAHVEPSPVAFATLLPHDEEHIDACYDGEPLRYRTMEDLLGDQPVPGLVPHDLEAQLHLLCDDGEPRSFAEAERDAAWRAAMKTEMDAVEQNRTWELADLPRGHRAITLKWVFKLKRDEAGVVIKHKALLVAQGFVQQEGVDFDDAFAPVARMESVRLLLALAAQEGWRVHHMDVKSAFLNGDLKEEVYVHQPPGFAIPGKEGKVLRLRKALYGLWQAPRAWNAKLDSTLKRMGFEQSPHEAAVYRRGSGGNTLLVGV
jgi:hypothetical protein